MVNLFLLVAGAVLGGFAAWLAVNAKCNGILSEVRAQIAGLQSALENRERELAQLQERFNQEVQQRVKSQTELDQARLRLDEERRLLQNAEKSLANAFDALADKALKSNNQAFLELAKSTFETVQAQAKGDLETRQKAIDVLVGPLKDSLGRYEKQIQEIEKSRQGAYTSLSDQIVALQKVTGSLDVALRTPQVRGRWGEMTLRRVAELAGMSPYCDFTEQETLSTPSTASSGSTRQRPDMIVNLPGDRRIAVDAKAPLQAFLDAASASTPEERQAGLLRHSQQVRTHMTQLGQRSYWEQFDQAPDFVVLFLPGEAFFGAALEQDRTLIEDGIERGVILATPTTLIALLRAVAFGWRQEQATRQAQKISEIGIELYERIKKFIDRFEAVGTALRRAVDNYNQAAGSLESRLLPSARKLHEMGAVPGEEIADIDVIDELPRAIAVPERAGPD